jgi:hypothetical protein
MKVVNETAAERSFHNPSIARLAAALPAVEDARFSLYKSPEGYRAIMDSFAANSSPSS